MLVCHTHTHTHTSVDIGIILIQSALRRICQFRKMLKVSVPAQCKGLSWSPRGTQPETLSHSFPSPGQEARTISDLTSCWSPWTSLTTCPSAVPAGWGITNDYNVLWKHKTCLFFSGVTFSLVSATNIWKASKEKYGPNSCTYEVTVVMTVCTRPMQA